MNRVGIHIRITESLYELAQKAVRLQVPFFQCFFSIQDRMSILRPTRQQISDFIRIRRTHFMHLYAHGSYWINLARVDNAEHYALNCELQLARTLEFTHFVIHPGSTKGSQKKEDGIDAVVRALNIVLKKQSDIVIVLENAAHGNMTIGGDIHDLALIYAKLNQPERVAVCIDTAHAHVYGYDIVTEQGRHAFITTVDNVIGLTHVVLLHINDTSDACGSKLDRHQLLGKGSLGLSTLQAFATDQRLYHIPILTEPPIIEEEIEREQLMIMRSWYEQKK